MAFGIRAKLLLGFAAVLVLTALVGGVGLYNLGVVTAVSGLVYDQDVVPLQDAGLARAALGQLDSVTQRALLDPSPQNRAQHAATADKEIAEFEQLLGGIEQSSVGDAAKAAAALRGDWKTYRDGAQGVLRAAAAGDTAAGTKLYLEQVAPARTRWTWTSTSSSRPPARAPRPTTSPSTPPPCPLSG